ncbi:MAG: ADOP family duplicated permease [Longimicrobiales bacterium]
MWGRPWVRRLIRLSAGERSRVALEIEDEIDFHLTERIASLVAGGVTPGEAKRRAEGEFGDRAEARLELAAIDGVTVGRERLARAWAAVVADVRLGLRGLRRSPMFASTVVIALGLGIGVNAAMFGITDRLLLSPPPHVRDADGLVRVLSQFTSRASGELVTGAIYPYADVISLRDDVAAFRDVAAYTRGAESALGRGVDASELRVSYVTGNFFGMLGARPAAGRFFTDAEDALPRGERVVVLSHAFWQRQFGGDRSVFGRRVEIDHAWYEVIGVAPEGFTGVDLRRIDAWALATAIGPDWAGGDEWYSDRTKVYWLSIVARLDPEVNAEIARQEASAVFVAAHEERFVGDQTARIVLGSIIAARAPAVGVATAQRSGRIALWLLGVSVVVLLITCANVANLLLTRGLRRGREIGIRIALGAGRGRVALQVLFDTVVLAAAGLTFGLLLAHWGGDLVRAALLSEGEWSGSPVGRRVLVFAGMAACVSAMLAALVPAFHAMRVDAGDLLRSGGRTTHRRSTVRSGLVALQAALSLVLLVGAGLFVRSLHNAASIALGFDADRVATFRWHSSGLDWDSERVRALYDAGLESVQALPEVEAAALAMTEPMWSARYGDIRVPGLDSVPRPRGEGPFFTPVSPDYFRAIGARILRGRPFTADDVPGSAAVAIVTESMARLVWPGEDPLGRCFVVLDLRDDACRVIVGLMEDTRYSTLEDDPTPMFFLPMAQGPSWSARTLFVRLKGEPDLAIAAVRRALLQIEPGLPHVRAQLLRSRVDPQLQPWRLGSTLFTAFGLLALVMSGLGLYGVVAYDVAQRRREFGVRTALGARATTLVTMVLRDAGRVIVLGLAAGLALAVWAAVRIESLLFDVPGRDPAVLAAAAALLLAIGLLAAALPAWRAARIEAMEVLREE